jgi:hypothetical protein
MRAAAVFDRPRPGFEFKSVSGEYKPNQIRVFWQSTQTRKNSRPRTNNQKQMSTLSGTSTLVEVCISDPHYVDQSLYNLWLQGLSGSFDLFALEFFRVAINHCPPQYRRLLKYANQKSLILPMLKSPHLLSGNYFVWQRAFRTNAKTNFERFKWWRSTLSMPRCCRTTR